MQGPDPATERWSRLSEAAAYALTIHAHQPRKGTHIPYISHLLSVAGLVLEHGGDEEQAIAGLLHDAIEDCGAEQEVIITERFGPRVARIVKACTDATTIPKPSWRMRKEKYLLHLRQADEDALLVSCCDKLHNARAILTDLRTHGQSVFDRFNAGKEETLWYYHSLADAFSHLLPNNPVSRDLRDTVEQIRAAR